MYDTLFRALTAQLPAADTVVTVSARGGLETAAMISSIVVGAFFLLLLPILFVLFLQIRKINRTVKELGDKGLQRAEPLIESGKSVADNLAFVSYAVRTDVEKITSSVKSLSDRLQQASDRMEERIAEFNALMEVVQSEAETIFVDTAATVRGVREGARTLAAGSRLDGDEPDEQEEGEEELRLAQPDEGPTGEAYLSRPGAGR
jgi:hypothetical protein